MSTTLRIEHLDEAQPHALSQHYSGQTNPQDAYIALDIRDGRMWADWNREIGNAVPMSVWHGLVRRYTIPPLMAEAANRFMDAIAPLAQRVLDGAEAIWDGSNLVARFSDDAREAEEAVDELTADFDHEDICFAVGADWYYDDATTFLTAETTDEEIEAWMDKDFTPVNYPNAVIDRDAVTQWMREHRDELREDEDEEDIRQIVIVRDGQYRWGADREELLAALDRLGWEKTGRQWTEPASPDEEDPAGAYTALCQEVQSAPCYGPDDDFNDDDLDQFVWRPDWDAWEIVVARRVQVL